MENKYTAESRLNKYRQPPQHQHDPKQVNEQRSAKCARNFDFFFFVFYFSPHI